MRRIVLMGDSITYGSNSSSSRSCWAGRLEEFLKSSLYSKCELINSSTKRETAQAGFNEVEDKVIKYTPDIVFIGYGTNDCAKIKGIYVNDIYNFESNIEDIAEAVRSQTNASIIFNLAPPVIEGAVDGDILIHNRDITVYNNVVKRICSSMMLSFIDHYRLMSDREDVNKLFDIDGIHPNDEGHRVIFENILSSAGHLFG